MNYSLSNFKQKSIVIAIIVIMIMVMTDVKWFVPYEVILGVIVLSRAPFDQLLFVCQSLIYMYVS